MTAQFGDFRYDSRYHGPHNDSVETRIVGHRDDAAPHTRAYERWRRHADACLDPKTIAASVPAVPYYHSRQAKAMEAEAAVSQAEQVEARAQAALRKLLADGDGADLAVKIGRAEADVKAAAAKLADAQDVAAKARADVEHAQTMARNALKDHVKRSFPNLVTEEQAAHAKCAEAILPMLDELSALKINQENCGVNVIERRLVGVFEALVAGSPAA